MQHLQAVDLVIDGFNNINMPVVNFEDENGVDSENALEKACNRAEKILWDNTTSSLSSINSRSELQPVE